MGLGALLLEISEVSGDLGRDEEFFVRETKPLAGLVGELHTGLTMGLVGAFDLRDTLSDDGLADDNVGLALGGLGLVKGRKDLLEIVAVDHLDVPAIGGIACAHILALADIQHRVEGDVVGIEENNQVVEAEVTRQRGGLRGDAFLETAITAKSDDMVVQDGVLGRVEPGCCHFLRHGVADGVGNSLTEGAGGRLNTRGLVELGMAGGDAVELTELLHLIQAEIKARKVEPGVKEHAAVAGGEDEAVSVDPARIGRIDLQGLTEKDGTDVGRTEGEAEVTGFAGGNGVNGEAARVAGGEFKDLGIHKIGPPEQTERPSLASLQEALFRLLFRLVEALRPPAAAGSGSGKPLIPRSVPGNR